VLAVVIALVAVAIVISVVLVNCGGGQGIGHQ
jgi:hypothetical protein